MIDSCIKAINPIYLLGSSIDANTYIMINKSFAKIFLVLYETQNMWNKSPLRNIVYMWNLIRFFQLFKAWKCCVFVLLYIYFTSIVQIVCYKIEVWKYVLVKQILRYKNSVIALLLIDTDIYNYIKYDHMYTTQHLYSFWVHMIQFDLIYLN